MTCTLATLRKLCLTCCVALIGITCFFTSAQQASAVVPGETISLTREKILELSARNYVAVREQSLQIQMNEAQLQYANDQLNELDAYKKPDVQALPTDLDELRALIPGYDNLTEAEKTELDATLMIQAMINASMNELLAAMASSEYAAGRQQWHMQIDALEEEIDNGIYQLKISQLEKEKLQLSAQYYALYSYYEIIGLDIDLRAAQFEAQLAEAVVKDNEKLYQLGLATVKDMEQAKQLAAERKKTVNQGTRQLGEKKQLFAQILGIKEGISITLPEINDMKLTTHYHDATIHIEKQIDYIKAEEGITQTKTSLAEAETDILADYLNTLLKVETDRKTMLEEALKEKVVLLHSEKDQLELKADRLEEEQERLVTKLKDYNKLLSIGSISERELEAVSHELTRLKFSIEKANLELLLWQDKKRIAVLGALQ